MIAVDTSALMAIVLNESEADACIGVLEVEGDLLISAAIVAEACLVAARRNVGDEMARGTLETASPTMWRRSIPAPCSSSVTIFREPTSGMSSGPAVT